MWTGSVAIAIRNTGLIELIMWTGYPNPIRSPMLQMMLIMATAMLATINGTLRNINQRATAMTIPAMGEKRPIWRNIYAPNVSRAIGSPERETLSPLDGS